MIKIERKLVTIRKVSEIKPIPNADNIELALVDGWQVVCKKGEFKQGDLGVYFEIDSFLPVEERYEFLRKDCYKVMADGTSGFRLKTIKLRGQLSQGLLLPLNMFPEIKHPELGAEVTELLKVKKYEPPVPINLSGVVKGIFPSFINRSDQERIQNLPDYFERYKDVMFEETEKVDGTSVTYYSNEGEFGVCSRNLELKEDTNNTLWKMAEKLDIKQMLQELDMNIAIQGELVGEGIQKNPLKLIGQKYLIYDIYDIDKRRYLTQEERLSLLYKLKPNYGNIEHVPITCVGIQVFEVYSTMPELLEHAKGSSAFASEREGLVFKSLELIDGNTVSFKVVNNRYLLNGE